jgi:hypothetical protein
MAYMKTTPAGLGAYQKTPVPWTFLRYPPPYAFADPAQIPPPKGVFYADAHEMGMAGCGCGGSCGGCSRGMGAIVDGLTTPLIALGVAAALAAVTAYFSKGARRR